MCGGGFAPPATSFFGIGAVPRKQGVAQEAFRRPEGRRQSETFRTSDGAAGTSKLDSHRLPYCLLPSAFCPDNSATISRTIARPFSTSSGFKEIAPTDRKSTRLNSSHVR